MLLAQVRPCQSGGAFQVYEVTIPPGKELRGLHLSDRRGEGAPVVQRFVMLEGSSTTTIRGLPAGTYTLSGDTPSGRQSMSIQVPASGVITFQPAIPTALAMRWNDAAEYPGSVGLQKDDLIVGIDGSDDGSRSAQTIVQGTLLAKAECRLTVDRSGRRFEVTVDTTKFARATQNGHLLEPVDC